MGTLDQTRKKAMFYVARSRLVTIIIRALRIESLSYAAFSDSSRWQFLQWHVDKPNSHQPISVNKS
jgi:hypothetical protein